MKHRWIWNAEMTSTWRMRNPFLNWVEAELGPHGQNCGWEYAWFPVRIMKVKSRLVASTIKSGYIPVVAYKLTWLRWLWWETLPHGELVYYLEPPLYPPTTKNDSYKEESIMPFFGADQ